jgi:hypothetical protein
MTQEYGLWYEGPCGGWVLDDLNTRQWAWRGTKEEAEVVADEMVKAGSDRPIVKPFREPWRAMLFGRDPLRGKEFYERLEDEPT